MRTNNITYTRFTNARVTQNKDELTPVAKRSELNVGLGIPNFISTNAPANSISKPGDIIYNIEADQVDYFSSLYGWQPINAPERIPSYADFYLNIGIPATAYVAGESVPLAIGRVANRATFATVLTVDTSILNYPKIVNASALTVDVMVTTCLTLESDQDTTTVAIMYVINNVLTPTTAVFAGVIVNPAQAWQITGNSTLRLPAGAALSLYITTDKNANIEVKLANLSIQELRSF